MKLKLTLPMDITVSWKLTLPMDLVGVQCLNHKVHKPLIQVQLSITEMNYCIIIFQMLLC